MGLSIVIYLFLGGTGAGACLVAACLGISALRSKNALSAESFYAARKTLTSSFMAAAFCLAAGACFLLVDLGRPDRALSLLTRPSPSYVAVGAWALGVCLCLALLLAFSWKRHATLPPALGFALHGAATVVAAVVMAYTGLLLASIMATPLWNSPWLAPLFFLSAASCGCAVVLLCARSLRIYRTHPHVMRALLLTDGVVIVLEAAATVAFVVCATGPAGPATLAAQTAAALPHAGLSPYYQAQLAGAFTLVRGAQAQWFWGGYALCGIAAPLALELAARRSPRLEPTLAPMCAISALMGGFALRYCMVLAGTQAVGLL